MFPNVKKKIMGVGGWSLTCPSFSRIFIYLGKNPKHDYIL